MRKPQTIIRGVALVAVWWMGALAAFAVTTTDFSRYQVILDRQPFGEVAPIVVPGAAEQAAAEAFAKDYEMKAIIDDGEKLQVCVLDKKASKHIYLDIGQEISGMQLVSVNYDDEEAVLKSGQETTVIKLRQDKDKDKGAAPAMAAAPVFGMPAVNTALGNSASPFGAAAQVDDSRKPFFSDIKRRGASPFRRMGTNAHFQPRSLESFFKPNTNMTTPFISPFRPQSSPLQPAGLAGTAGQVESKPAFPFVPDGGSSGAGQPAGMNQPLANPGYGQTPAQPMTMPLTDPVVEEVIIEIEE